MHDAHCQAFYIDLGSNIGVQIRKLFEPERYPLAAAKPIFNHYFSRSRQHVCAIGVEPNPQHYNRLRALEGYYHARNHTFAFIAAAVVEPPFQLVELPVSHERGVQTAFSQQANLHLSGAGSGRESVSVPSLDVSWLLQTWLPKWQSSSVAHTPIVMKMDIEGMEDTVLQQLLHSGSLCASVDIVMLEAHYKTPQLAPRQRALTATWRAVQSQHAAGRCRTRIISLDDEVYTHDIAPSDEVCASPKGRRGNSSVSSYTCMDCVAFFDCYVCAAHFNCSCIPACQGNDAVGPSLAGSDDAIMTFDSKLATHLMKNRKRVAKAAQAVRALPKGRAKGKAGIIG